MKLPLVYSWRRIHSVTSVLLATLICAIWVTLLDSKGSLAVQWIDRASGRQHSAGWSRFVRAGIYNNLKCHDVRLCPSVRHQHSLANIQELKNVRNKGYNAKSSRISLVLGDQGVEALKASNVLVVGTSKLALEIITHLVRSGVGRISIWDANVPEAKNLIAKVKVLHPDATIQFLEQEPDYDGDLPNAVVFVDQPFEEAIKVNAKVRNTSKFIFARSCGVYGVVLSDFGDSHKAVYRSDKRHTEHQGTVKSDATHSTVEVTGNEDLHLYKEGSIITISFPEYLCNKAVEDGISNSIVGYAKVLAVNNISDNAIKLKVDANMNHLPKTGLSVRIFEPPTIFRFSSLDALASKILHQGISFYYSFWEFFKQEGVPPERLVIAPASGNNLDRTTSILALLLGAGKKCISDQAAEKAFNTLKNVNLPAIATLIGSLSAQEVVKGLSGTFTPSELIIVDRSDIIPGNGIGLSLEDVNRYIKMASNLDYLLVGAGALGCEYLKMLSNMGVTHVTVVDNDTVEISNLTRQTLFTSADVGLSKARSAVKNLRLITQADLSNYVPRQEMFTESFKLGKHHRDSPVVVLSAVDNLHSRLLMDNFAVENSYMFVEAGIHGMQCSTSISLPYITDSYGSTVGTEASTEGRNSCSVKGIPTTTDDTVFYAMELFSWLFHSQHEVFNEFLKDPLRTLIAAMGRGEKHFINVAQSIIDNCNIATKGTYAKDWANQTYVRHFNVDFALKGLLIDSMAAIKMRSVTISGSGATLDNGALQELITSTKELVKAHFDKRGIETASQACCDCLDMVERIYSDPAVIKLLKDGGTVRMKPLVFSDIHKDYVDFLFAASNIRAYKFGIRQSDMTTVMKTAKNLVPAISTTVGVAASMAMLELHKAVPLLAHYKETTMATDVGMLNEKLTDSATALPNSGAINTNIRCIMINDEAICYKNGKRIANMRLFNYDENCTVSDGILNHFFNLSIMKYFPKTSDNPAVLKISNEEALLKGRALSMWDHITVHDSCKPSVTSKESDGLSRSGELNCVTVSDIVAIVMNLFGATVEALLSNGHYVRVTAESARETLRKAFKMEDACTIYLVARDNQLRQLIELPFIKFMT